MERQDVTVNGPDFVEQAAQRAADLFTRPEGTSPDGTFDSVSFSRAFAELTRLDCGIGQQLVAAILSGRHSIVRLPDGDRYVSLVAAETAQRNRGFKDAFTGPINRLAQGSAMCEAQEPTGPTNRRR